MIRLAPLALVALAGFPQAVASPGPFALGIIAGDPTGITGRYRLSSTHAVDGSVGWNYWNGTHIQGAYVWRYPNAFQSGHPEFEWYVGIGGNLWTWSRSHCSLDWCERRSTGAAVGVHVPVGLSYLFREVPLEVFGHLAPDLVLIPATSLWIHLALGVRFYL